MKHAIITLALFISAVSPSARQSDVVVAMADEPRHPLVFESGSVRVHDVRIPPGDTSLYHVHDVPVLYVILSASPLRVQVLGKEWSSGAGAAATAAATRPASTAPARVVSTTSYAERPETHRVHNVGDALFHRIAIGTTSKGADSSADDISGLGSKPELENRYYRVYRVSLAPGRSTPTHAHAWPVVVVQQTAGQLAVGGSSRPTMMTAPGSFAFHDGSGNHTVANPGTSAVEFVEVEVRGASPR
jgi:quercetin dioxygenase-like cupin family protein